MNNYIIIKQQKSDYLFHILYLYKNHIKKRANDEKNKLFVQIVKNIKEGVTISPIDFLLKNSEQMAYKSNRINLMIDDIISKKDDNSIAWENYLDILTFQNSSLYKETIKAYPVGNDFYLSSDSIDFDRLYLFFNSIGVECIRIHDKDFDVKPYVYDIFKPYNSVYLHLNSDFINLGDLNFEDDTILDDEEKEIRILDYISNNLAR